MSFEYRAFPEKYFGKNVEFKPEDPTLFKKRQSKFRQHLIRFIESLPQNARVLDAGCGNAKVTKNILTLRPDIKVYAMDITDVTAYIPKGVEFKVGSVETLDTMYEPQFFDAVISLHVIEHLLFPMDMITSMRKVLKPQGKIFLETPNWMRIFMPFSQHFFWNDYTHIRPFSKFAMYKLLSEYGFTKINMVTTNTMTLLNKSSQTSCCESPTHSKGESEGGSSYPRRSLFARISLRLVHPLFKDVLIVEAVKGNEK